MIRIYSIGYRGVIPSKFWNLLLENGVDVLIDIRPRPRRALLWGTSVMRRGGEWRGVEYHHWPILGGMLGENGAVSTVVRLVEIASHRTVALMSAEPLHVHSHRQRVIRLAGAVLGSKKVKTEVLYIAPLQQPLFTECELSGCASSPPTPFPLGRPAAPRPPMILPTPTQPALFSEVA